MHMDKTDFKVNESLMFSFPFTQNWTLAHIRVEIEQETFQHQNHLLEKSECFASSLGSIIDIIS